MVKKKIVKKKAVKKKVAKKRAKRKSMTLKLNDNGLTGKEQSFADNYITMKDSAAAYRASTTRKITAATARSNGFRTKNKPRVKAYLDKRNAEIQKAVEYSQEDWLRDVLKVKEIAMGERGAPNTIVYDGVPILIPDVKKFEGSTATKILDMLGKTKPLDVYADKTSKIDLDGGGQIAELLSMIKPTLGPPSKRKE